ncbi:MAG: hypothetical protein ABJH72_23975 [Reichenbachiella sp.]|uniref:hypothetical protein n=1 Tax=Reichenbachiella sp. TaxID=2184521 RepID=UPI003263EBEA
MDYKTILILLLLTAAPVCGWAQIKTTVTSNNRWFNNISQTGASYQSKKKAIRDSLKNMRRLDRYYEKKTDSLFLASHLAHRYKEPTYGFDSTLSYRSPLQDEYAYYEALYLNKDTGSQWSADSLAPYPNQGLPKLSLESIENSDLFSSQIRELETFNTQRDLITGQQAQIDGYQTQMASGQEQMEEASASLVTSKPAMGRNSILKLTKVQTVAQNTSLNGVENTIKNYKKKYESLVSIEDIGKVKTRNSMASLPLKRRLKVGGSLQLTHDQYLNIDFSPSIAYRWTRRLSTGLGFAYRAEFGNGKEWYNSLDSKTYGGRLFTEYGLFKSFYAHAESETMVSKKSELVQSSSQTTWGLMAGVGKTFSLTGNLRGNLLLQYNFTYDDTSQIYSSPWVLRLGFEIQNLEKIFPTHKKGSTHE